MILYFNKKVLNLIALIVIGLIFSGTISAAVKTSISDGSWGTPVIWSPAGVPATNDTVLVYHALTSSSDVTIQSGGQVFVYPGASLNITGNLRIECDSCRFFNYDSTTVSNTIFNDLGGKIFNSPAGTLTVGSIFNNNHASSEIDNYGYVYVGNLLNADNSSLNGNGNYDVCIAFNINGTFINGPIDRCGCDGVTDPFIGIASYTDPGVSLCSPRILEGVLSMDDYDTTFINAVVVIDILLNDTARNSPIVISSVDTTGLLAPKNGNLTLINDTTGAITYIPDPSYTGADTFQYVVCDSFLMCDTATVYVFVEFYPSENSCSNGIDDDGDGLIDCLDGDCSTAQICACTGAEDTIRGTVFNDVNGNGIFEPADTGLNAVTIRLYTDVNQNGILDGSDSAIDSVVSASDGSYEFTINPPTPTLFTKQVSFGVDDAYEKLSDGGVSINDKLKLGYHGLEYTVATRFRNVTIPKSATILTAYLEFYAHDGQTGTTDLIIYGEAADVPAAYSISNSDISSRATTTDSVLWSETTAWIQDQIYQTADLSAIVTEMINRPGWTTGGVVAFMVKSDGVTGKRNGTDWNKTPSKAPNLVVSYIDSASSNYFIVDVNDGGLPASFTYTTPMTQAAVFSCGGQLESDIDFGGTVVEICGNLIDDDADGLIDCLDTLDCRPSQPGNITASNSIVCSGQTGEIYSIAAVTGATSYSWTVPAGASITSGQGTISITLTWASTQGNVCVVSNNGFCDSPAQCETIDMRYIPTAPSTVNH